MDRGCMIEVWLKVVRGSVHFTLARYFLLL